MKSQMKRLNKSTPADPAWIEKRTRGYLPHWERDGGTYFITFRLYDSLPQPVLDQIARQRAVLARARQTRKLLPTEAVTAEQLNRKKIEAYLDSGYGECFLRHPEAAALVADSLRFRDGQRYTLHAWCIMPNHVHVLCELFSGQKLTPIVGGWKSFTVRKINAILHRKGQVWQHESFDHLIRNEREFNRAVEYIANNPAKAGLIGWRWVFVRQGARFAASAST
jgi:REP element-mobilizing transposase RayT